MNPSLRACIAELIGTFTLTFIGAGAIIANHAGGDGGLVAVALAHGLALAAAVYATNGHINPAVTLAMVATRRIGVPLALGYIVCQLGGAVIAALALRSLYPEAAVAAAKLGATLGTDANQAALGPMRTALLEAVLTFLLGMAVFGTAVDRRAAKNIFGFTIGLTVAFDILVAGPLTGASMNPARSFGPALVGGYWTMHHVYWLGPLLGALVAAILYEALLLPDDQKVTPV